MTVDRVAWTRHFDTVCAFLELPLKALGIPEDIRHGVDPDFETTS
jgi:hypothetical protein